MSRQLPPGKLPPDLLGPLIARIPSDPSVLIGAGIGRDAAAVRVSKDVIVLKSDPITFAIDDIGWYAANVNANDVACMGATPRWMLVTSLLPEASTTPELVERIFSGLHDACARLRVTLVGGHTEITVGLDRPILIGMMAGEAREADLIDPRRASPGDVVILARGIAIEGTSLIAREIPERLAAHFGPAFVARCQDFLYDPGISVVRTAEGLRAAVGADLHALHDPTEGGLATGLRELAEVSGGGVTVERAAIPVFPETEAICDALGLDPLGLISSGALLAVVAPEAVERALGTLNAVGIPAAAIGRLTPEPGRITMLVDGHEQPLPEFAVDEIARLFAGG